RLAGGVFHARVVRLEPGQLDRLDGSDQMPIGDEGGDEGRPQVVAARVRAVLGGVGGDSLQGAHRARSGRSSICRITAANTPGVSRFIHSKSSIWRMRSRGVAGMFVINSCS